MKKTVNIVLLFLCSTLVVLFIIITYQAVMVNENWEWAIDFEDGNKTINSYGAITAAIISLLSAILLIYTIFTQLNQFKKQKKQFNKQLETQEIQFNKQFQLQTEQFEAEKRKQEFDEKKDMFFQLKFVEVYLKSFIRHIEIMESEIKRYIKIEKENPIMHVNMNFNINKDAETLSKIEILSLFKTFQFFFETDDESWVKKFNDLFGIVDFYNEMLNELLINNKAHVREKYDQKVKISNELSLLMQNTKRIAVRYRETSADYIHLPYYLDLEDLVGNYNQYLKTTENQETDINFISQSILSPFIESLLPLISNPETDEFGLMDLLDQTSMLRKTIFFTRTTAETYVTNIERRYNEYFKPENSHLIRLKEIYAFIKSKLSQKNINNL